MKYIAYFQLLYFYIQADLIANNKKTSENNQMKEVLFFKFINLQLTPPRSRKKNV